MVMVLNVEEVMLVDRNGNIKNEKNAQIQSAVENFSRENLKDKFM
jgi:hypothetical protein